MFDYLIQLYETEKYKRQQDPDGYDAATSIYREKGPKDSYRHYYVSKYNYKTYSGLTYGRDALVNYTMAMAIRILLQYPDISPSNKINIICTNKESQDAIYKTLRFSRSDRIAELGTYYWTSLVLIGMTLPDPKFDHNSITTTPYSARNKYQDQLGFFSRFGSNSLYENEFNKRNKDTETREGLCHETIRDILIDSSHESRAVQQAQETAAARIREKDQSMTRVQTLCLLASNGNLREIITNDYTTEEINTNTRFAVWGGPPIFLGYYNALFIAASYRHINVVKYFVEDKQADIYLKGAWDYTVLDCAKQTWLIGPAVDLDIVSYLEFCKYNESIESRFTEQSRNPSLLETTPRKRAWTNMNAEKVWREKLISRNLEGVYALEAKEAEFQSSLRAREGRRFIAAEEDRIATRLKTKTPKEKDDEEYNKAAAYYYSKGYR